jgi:hypothetical protein
MPYSKTLFLIIYYVVQQQAYSQYLQQKKLYKDQLEKENQARLEKIRKEQEQVNNSHIQTKIKTIHNSVFEFRRNKPKFRNQNNYFDPKMDESIDEFQENFKLIKEKKLKLAQISRFLSPTNNNSNTSTTSNSSTLNPSISSSKLFSPTKPATSTSNALKSSNEFKKPKPVSSKSANSSKISKYFTSQTPSFSCPVCNEELGKSSETDRQRHVNACLDKGFSMQKTNKFVRNPTETNTETGSENEEIPKPVVQTPEETTKKIVYPAIESKKDPLTEKETKLEKTQTTPDSKLNLSQEERMKIHNQNLLKDAVPNCPICGKVLTKHSVIIFDKI